MPVTQGDLSLKRSETSGDVAATNGGRLTDGSINESLFPDITGAERTAGLTRYRKFFFKNEAGTGALPLKYSDVTLSLLSGKVYMENFSAADDNFFIRAGTPSDVQTSAAGYSGWGVTGYLNANVSAGATSLQIVTETNGGTGEHFLIGGTMLISDYLNGLGNREFLTISSVSWASNVATIGFTSTPLQNNYNRNALAADRTADIFSSTTIGYTLDAMSPNAHVGRRVRIKSGTGSGQTRKIASNTVTTITVNYAWAVTPDATSVYEVFKTMGCMCVSTGDIKCAYSNVTVTSVAGTFTATGNLKLFPVGCRDDTWTLLFSGATSYTISGAYYGSVAGTYSTLSTARPPNASSYYFEIPAAAWGGTWATGNTLTFTTTSASAPIWLKQVVPAGAAAHLSNSIDIGCSGDTA